MAHGLADGLDPGPPQAGDSYDPAVAGEARLPRTLGDALALLQADEVVQGAFERPLYDAFVEYKTDEWERFCGTVTEWHREMYLRALP
jgi:glutamine synthetase